MRKQKGFIAMIAIALLLGAACSPSKMLRGLTAIVNAAEYAFDQGGKLAGLDPATIAAADKWLEALSKGTAAVADILEGPGTGVEKSALIVQALSGFASGCGCLKPGTPTLFVNAMNAVSQAVVEFLKGFQPTRGLGAPSVSAIETVTSASSKELTDIRKRSEAIIGAIERKKK
jgi:hypothetical protein